jgi:hypothetical protein
MYLAFAGGLALQRAIPEQDIVASSGTNHLNK